METKGGVGVVVSQQSDGKKKINLERASTIALFSGSDEENLSHSRISRAA